MMDRTIVIVNPNSKGGQTGKNWDSINSILKRYFGDDIESVFTEKAGDGIRLAREYLEKGFKNIIPIGGDGMINEVSNGFFKVNISKNFDLKDMENKDLSSFVHADAINPEATLTLLPSGTRNVLIKSLDLPSEFEECCKYLSTSNTIKNIDTILAIVNDSNSENDYVYRFFLNAAEIGLGAEIIDRSKTVREKVSSSRLLSTITGIVTTLPVYKSNTCDIIEGSSDNNKINNRILTNMTMGVISNGSYLGGGFQVAIKADMTDGLLDTIIIKNSDSFKILNKLVNIKKGEESIINENDIYYGQSQTVTLISKEEDSVSISADGEPIGILPAFFKVFHQVLKIRS
jgi:diacylglycerol kinase family enzyme